MSYRGYGPLTGKARRAHNVKRMEREMCYRDIEELELEQNELPTPNRFIPVNHGSDVLASAGLSEQSLGERPFSQAELPFSSSQPNVSDSDLSTLTVEVDTAAPDEAWKPFEHVSPSPSAKPSNKTKPANPASNVVIPSRLPRPQEAERTRRGYTASGIFAGAALGSAIAIVLLGCLYLIMG